MISKLSNQITQNLLKRNVISDEEKELYDYGLFSLVSSTGSSAKSRSKWLWGKEGKSFGYYYVNGVQRHKSTAWMDFDF